MLYFINIGNRYTEWIDEHWHQYQRKKTKEFLPITKNLFSSKDQLVISSVFVESEKFFQKNSLNYTILNFYHCEKFFCLDKAKKEEIGIDRLINLVSALQSFSPPLMVIDCGTCITVELLNQQKEFYGGFILPNKYLQKKTLNENIPQLPLTQSKKKYSPFQLGLNTNDAIEFGLHYSLIAFMEKTINVLQQQFKPLTILFTGGDRLAYYKEIKDKFSCHLAHKDFNLQGIKKVWEYHNE